MKYLNLWGKTSKDDEAYPLICHMLDTSAVAKIWLEKNDILKELFLQLSCIESSDADFINLLLWLVAMHDIGKATVSFQNKIPELAKYADIYDENRIRLLFNHGLYGAYLFSLYNFIIEAKEWNTNIDENEQELYSSLNNFRDALNTFENYNFDKAIIDLLKASSWHHGDIFNNEKIKNGFQEESNKSISFKRLTILRDELIGKLNEFFKIKNLKLSYNKNYHPSLLKCFAGFVSVCDWIASGEDIFDGNYNENLDEHFNKSCNKADGALKRLGIINDFHTNNNKSFYEFFDFSPRGVQSEIEKVIDNNENISLLIIEAPTGEGKTEAALYSHYRFNHNGLYFALPSQATANQMFKRIDEFYKNKLDIKLPIILAHGMSWLNKDYNKVKFNLKELEDHSGYNSLNEWFYTKKKTLLAPVGVGTIDQVMLSVLKTRHYFVKLFALAGKTLIIDEVHAYDYFMMPIIKRLLEWCNYLKIKVILLSATLPEVMKKELLSGYFGNKKDEINFFSNSSYPLITTISSESINQYAVQSTRKKEEIKINLFKYNGSIELIARYIKDKLSNGGNILWICNTVKRSQEVFDFLKTFFEEKLDIILFHSRFTFYDRDVKEKYITNLYGKEKKDRPFKSIVVATQVVEQSLDIDFDYLISDIAPIDLLLQRFGRMHRHERDNRPDYFKTPECMILIPECEIKGPMMNKSNKWQLAEDLKGFAEVYEPLIIYKTIKCLSEINIIKLPQMYRSLVESVYSEKNDFTDIFLDNNISIKKEVWENSYKSFVDKKNEMEKEAAVYITESPLKTIDFIEGVDITPTFEEDDGKATTFIAKTRYGNELEINLIIAKLKDHRLSIGDIKLELNDNFILTYDLQKNIIENSVKMSSPKNLVIKILKREIKTFEDSKELLILEKEIQSIPGLKNYFIVILNDNNSFKIDKYDILYLKETGLKILKEEDEE